MNHFPDLDDYGLILYYYAIKYHSINNVLYLNSDNNNADRIMIKGLDSYDIMLKYLTSLSKVSPDLLPKVLIVDGLFQLVGFSKNSIYMFKKIINLLNKIKISTNVIITVKLNEDPPKQEVNIRMIFFEFLSMYCKNLLFLKKKHSEWLFETMNLDFKIGVANLVYNTLELNGVDDISCCLKELQLI